MKPYKWLVCCLLLVALLNGTGCKKYLAVKSDASLVVPGTTGDLQALLDDASFMNYNTPALGASSADDFFMDDATYTANPVFGRHVYQWIPYPCRYPNDWSLAYRAIYNANVCLERVGLIAPATNNQQQLNSIKGAALFYRAYYFLELSWLFAKAYDSSTAQTDPGIVLRTGADFNVPSVRATVKASYEKIIQDAGEAAALLPDNPQQLTRPSKCAAYALLARAYLSMRQYDSAGKYAGLALQIKNTLMDYNNPGEVDLSAGNPFKRFNSETVFYTTMNSYIALYHPIMNNARVDTNLYAAYDGNDLRRAAFFTAAGSYYSFKGNYAADYFDTFSGIATDELWLTRAECSARAGNTAAALEDINSLLSKRWLSGTFVPVAANTAPEVLAIILKERQKELLFRGSLRWMDIKRLNRENANITLRRFIAGEYFTLPPNDNRYALQLPQDIIETAGLQQN